MIDWSFPVIKVDISADTKSEDTNCDSVMKVDSVVDNCFLSVEYDISVVFVESDNSVVFIESENCVLPV